MQHIYVGSYVELLQLLMKIDITVPERNDGRTPTDCERWSICRFLATFGNSDLFMYPLSLQHIDRPDFLITYDRVKIGIEATEAIYQSYAMAQYFWAKSYPNHIIDPSLFKHNNMTSHEIERIVSSNRLYGNGWEGDEAEFEWANHLNSVIQHKNNSANKDGFLILSKNWLLIYDNMHTTGIHIDKCATMLLDLICNSQILFNKIFIEHSDIFIHMDLQLKKYSAHEINNLWL